MEGRHVLSQLYQFSNDVAHFHHMIMISNILTSNHTNLYDWVGFLQLLGFYSETGPKREMVVRSIFTILPIAYMYVHITLCLRKYFENIPSDTDS